MISNFKKNINNGEKEKAMWGAVIFFMTLIVFFWFNHLKKSLNQVDQESSFIKNLDFSKNVNSDFQENIKNIKNNFSDLQESLKESIATSSDAENSISSSTEKNATIIPIEKIDILKEKLFQLTASSSNLEKSTSTLIMP